MSTGEFNQLLFISGNPDFPSVLPKVRGWGGKLLRLLILNFGYCDYLDNASVFMAALPKRALVMAR